MKGDRKGRHLGFKKGVYYARTSNESDCVDASGPVEVNYIRPTRSEAELMDGTSVVHEVLASTQNDSEKFKTTMLLRGEPEKRKRSSEQSLTSATERDADPGCYKLYHTIKLWDMINEVIKEHMTRNPACTGALSFDRNSEDQRGFVWRERVVCSFCKYESNMYKLYEEVEGQTGRGRKSATANLGINIALMQTPIAATSLRKIMAGGNIPPPSESGINKRNVAVSKLVIDANKSDMKRRRNQLRNINRWTGRPENQIAVQSDGVYNNSLYAGVGRTPFQPATQVTYTVAENMTTKKQIIAMETVNKLCSKHGFHTQADECTMENCPSTASMETNIGDEKRWAERCFRDLSTDGLEIKYLTTDGDTKAFQAASTLYGENITQTAPEHQLDTRHLSENHRKQMKNNSHVQNMMPGCTTGERTKLQQRFATDISKRCQSEFDCIVQRVRGNYTQLCLSVKDCITAMKRCYGGDHSACRLHSNLCKGEEKNNWLSNSNFLPAGFKIDLTNEDFEKTLLECIEYRLWDDIVALTRLNTNTQKVEGSNRAINRSVPKTVTFSRNFEARAHSAVFSVNNGPGQAIHKLCHKAGCPIPAGGKARAGLASLQRRSIWKKKHESTTLFKLKRRARRNKLYKLYEEHAEQKNYIKSQLMRGLRKSKKSETTVTKTEPGASTSLDHDYTRNPMNNKIVRARRRHSGMCPPKQ